MKFFSKFLILFLFLNFTQIFHTMDPDIAAYSLAPSSPTNPRPDNGVTGFSVVLSAVNNVIDFLAGNDKPRSSTENNEQTENNIPAPQENPPQQIIVVTPARTQSQVELDKLLETFDLCDDKK